MASKNTLFENKSAAFAVHLESPGVNGTGFLLRNETNVFLVTAKHVLFKKDDSLRSDELDIRCISQDPFDSSVNLYRVNLKEASIIKGKGLDVVAVIIGDIAEDSFENGKVIGRWKQKKGVEKLETGKTNAIIADLKNFESIRDVEIGTDVYMIGYPTSIGIRRTDQFDVNKPLLKKGIVSNIYFEKKILILDCSVYHGNSGSPVITIYYEETKKTYKIIGMISDYIPYIQEWKNQREEIINEERHNSGYSVAISMDVIIEMIESHLAARH